MGFSVHSHKFGVSSSSKVWVWVWVWAWASSNDKRNEDLRSRSESESRGHSKAPKAHEVKVTQADYHTQGVRTAPKTKQGLGQGMGDATPKGG